MRWPLVSLKRYTKLERDHVFAVKQLYYYKKKSERLEKEAIARNPNGTFRKVNA